MRGEGRGNDGCSRVAGNRPDGGKIRWRELSVSGILGSGMWEQRGERGGEREEGGHHSCGNRREFGVPDAGHSGIKVSILAVTSMHICARIFAWAWDFLVGGTSYPMQHVSTPFILFYIFKIFFLSLVEFFFFIAFEWMIYGMKGMVWGV